MRVLGRTEVAIGRKRLAVLERKERAHDAYLRATQHMGIRQRLYLHHPLPTLPESHDYYRGYLRCLADFGQMVVQESSVGPSEIM